MYPFLLLFYFGFVFESPINAWLKLAFVLAFYGISHMFKILFFDRDVLKYVPIATTLSFIFWSYVTYFIWLVPIDFGLDILSLGFLFATAMSWHNLYRAYKSDPGVLSNNHEQMSQVILGMKF